MRRGRYTLEERRAIKILKDQRAALILELERQRAEIAALKQELAETRAAADWLMSRVKIG